MICLECTGDGCSQCGGRGHRTIKDNPLNIVTSDGFALFKGYRWLKNYGIFPVRAGLQKQSAKFIRAVEFCDMITAKFDNVTKKYQTEKGKQIETMVNTFPLKKSKNGRR